MRGHVTVLTPMTGSSRTQVVHEALEIGKKARDGVPSWDHALSGTSALFANDKAPGTLVVGQLERVGIPSRHDAAPTDLGMATEAGKTRCVPRRWKRIHSGRRRASKVHFSCRLNRATLKNARGMASTLFEPTVTPPREHPHHRSQQCADV